MNNNLIRCAYPLNWPPSKERTSSHARKAGRYGSASSQHYYKRTITLREAQVRLVDEVVMFTPSSQRYESEWVINPDECVLYTMIECKTGYLRHNAKTPPDVGAVFKYRYKDRESVMAIDSYDELSQNIAALAACLKCLRGLTRHDESFLDAAQIGFSALPPPMTKRHWRSVFGVKDHQNITLKKIKAVRHQLFDKYHPDLVGENDGDWNRVYEINAAYDDAKAELNDAN